MAGKVSLSLYRKSVQWALTIYTSYHHSKTVEAALSLLEDRLLVIWLPKYSPFLNPIERFWLHFKQLTVANRLHRSLEKLDQTGSEVMAHHNTLNHPNRLRFLDKFRLVA